MIVTNFILFFMWGNWGSEELVCCLKSYKGDHAGIWCGKYCLSPASHCRHEPLWNTTAAVLSSQWWVLGCCSEARRCPDTFMEGLPCAEPLDSLSRRGAWQMISSTCDQCIPGSGNKEWKQHQKGNEQLSEERGNASWGGDLWARFWRINRSSLSIPCRGHNRQKK